MGYTLNIVIKCYFSLYLNINRLRKGRGKFFIWVPGNCWKSPGFFVSKRVGTLVKGVYNSSQEPVPELQSVICHTV